MGLCKQCFVFMAAYFYTYLKVKVLNGTKHSSINNMLDWAEVAQQFDEYTNDKYEKVNCYIGWGMTMFLIIFQFYCEIRDTRR